MISTYRLYHDGLVVQSWSKSYEGAAMAQLKRETGYGKWELCLVALNPSSLKETILPIASREIVQPRETIVREYWIVADDALAATYKNPYDVRKWLNAHLAGYKNVRVLCNGLEIFHANITRDENFLP